MKGPVYCTTFMDFESTALYEVVRPIFHVIRLMGLAPYDLPKSYRDADKRSSQNQRRIMTMYTIVPLCIYSFLVGVIVARFEVTEEDAKLGTNADTLLSKFFVAFYAMIFSTNTLFTMLVNYAVLLTELINSIITADQIVSVWNSIQDFDQSSQLEKTTKIRFSYSKKRNPLIDELRRNLIYAIVIGVVGWIIVSISGLVAYHETIFRNLNYAAAYYGNCIAVFKFCSLAFLLCQRFRYLNDVLLKRSMASNFGTQDYLFLMETESKYEKLLDAGDTLIAASGISLLLQTLTLFFSIVNNGQFFVYRMFKFDIDDFFYGVCEVCWINMFLVQLITLHVVCDHTSKEVKRCQYILSDWYRLAEYKGFCGSEPATRLLLRELNFSACGFFTLDMENLSSTFESIATYLVIILQIVKRN